MANSPDMKAVATSVPMDMFYEIREIIDDYNSKRTEQDTKITISNFLRSAIIFMLHSHRLHNDIEMNLHSGMIFDDSLDRVILLNTNDLKTIITEYMESVLQDV